jgi:hypothetical protein
MPGSNRVKHNLIKSGISWSSEQTVLIHKQRRDYKLINKKLHVTLGALSPVIIEDTFTWFAEW